MKVSELITKLENLSDPVKEQEVIVWLPGCKLSLLEVFESFDHPREKAVVMIEGQVIESFPNKPEKVQA